MVGSVLLLLIGQPCEAGPGAPRHQAPNLMVP
jgi:hypothetical protein